MRRRPPRAQPSSGWLLLTAPARRRRPRLAPRPPPAAGRRHTRRQPRVSWSHRPRRAHASLSSSLRPTVLLGSLSITSMTHRQWFMPQMWTLVQQGWPKPPALQQIIPWTKDQHGPNRLGMWSALLAETRNVAAVARIAAQRGAKPGAKRSSEVRPKTISRSRILAVLHAISRTNQHRGARETKFSSPHHPPPPAATARMTTSIF